MSVYLRAKFEVSSITLTSFRHGGGLFYPPPPPTQNEPLKSPPRLGLIPMFLKASYLVLLLLLYINDFSGVTCNTVIYADGTILL